MFAFIDKIRGIIDKKASCFQIPMLIKSEGERSCLKGSMNLLSVIVP